MTNPAFSNFSLLEFHKCFKSARPTCDRIVKKSQLLKPRDAKDGFYIRILLYKHSRAEKITDRNLFFPTEVVFEKSLLFQTCFLFQQSQKEAIPWQTLGFWKGHILWRLIQPNKYINIYYVYRWQTVFTLETLGRHRRYRMRLMPSLVLLMFFTTSCWAVGWISSFWPEQRGSFSDDILEILQKEKLIDL